MPSSLDSEQVRNARLCSACSTWLPQTDFYPTQGRCKPCLLAHKAKWYAENRERVNAERRAKAAGLPLGHRRDKDLKQRFGIGVEEVLELLKKQDGCGICHRAEPGTVRWWHVDHDHACCAGKKSCGKCVRGILCHRCNMLLGQAQDNTTTLNSAIEYLQRRDAHASLA